jgi:RNA methyltransferase, TrmH family
MPTITSTSNRRIKQIRALRRRAERERTGLFYAEGLRAVRAALDAGAEVEALVVAPALLTDPTACATVAAFRSAGGALLEVSAEVFASLSTRDGPRGLAVVARQRRHQLPPHPPRRAVWVALYGVQQPGNLGAVLRTCDAAGAAGLILLGATTDPYDPAAVRASMGTVFCQPLVRAELESFLAWARRGEVRLIGTSGEGGRDYRTLGYDPPLVLLMGAERQGLPPSLLARCDAVAHIPMAGRADSLNLAVAAGLILYEAVRYREAPAAQR